MRQMVKKNLPSTNIKLKNESIKSCLKLSPDAAKSLLPPLPLPLRQDVKLKVGGEELRQVKDVHCVALL